MKGKVFVHIGLPKTATTTLQTELFPAFSSNKINYLGVFQPRSERAQQALYTKLYAAVKSGQAIEDAQSALNEMLDNWEVVILSEEMFMVSEKEATWRTKLKNLSSLLDGLDYTLIVTVREPTSAIFSYYVELNTQFFRENKSFMELAMHDDRMHIFHYNKLMSEIYKNFDKKRVFVKKFEDIASGKVDDLCRLITPEWQDGRIVHFKKYNEKKGNGAVVFSSRKTTLADTVRRLFFMMGIIDARFVVKIKKLLSPVVRILDSVSLSKRKLIKPSQLEMSRLKEYLRAETAALEECCGIKYE